jgi:hypothetical protein
MRAKAHDDEWDQAWAEFDRHSALPVTVPTEGTPRREGCAILASILMPAIAMLLMPSATQTGAQDLAPALTRAVLSSHSPVEAGLPPLDIAVGRLLDESAEAACWVLRLLPQDAGCTNEAPAR